MQPACLLCLRVCHLHGTVPHHAPRLPSPSPISSASSLQSRCVTVRSVRRAAGVCEATYTDLLPLLEQLRIAALPQRPERGERPPPLAGGRRQQQRAPAEQEQQEQREPAQRGQPRQEPAQREEQRQAGATLASGGEPLSDSEAGGGGEDEYEADSWMEDDEGGVGGGAGGGSDVDMPDAEAGGAAPAERRQAAAEDNAAGEERQQAWNAAGLVPGQTRVLVARGMGSPPREAPPVQQQQQQQEEAASEPRLPTTQVAGGSAGDAPTAVAEAAAAVADDAMSPMPADSPRASGSAEVQEGAEHPAAAVACAAASAEQPAADHAGAAATAAEAAAAGDDAVSFLSSAESLPPSPGVEMQGPAEQAAAAAGAGAAAAAAASAEAEPETRGSVEIAESGTAAGSSGSELGEAGGDQEMHEAEEEEEVEEESVDEDEEEEKEEEAQVRAGHLAAGAPATRHPPVACVQQCPGQRAAAACSACCLRLPHRHQACRHSLFLFRCLHVLTSLGKPCGPWIHSSVRSSSRACHSLAAW